MSVGLTGQPLASLQSGPMKMLQQLVIQLGTFIKSVPKSSKKVEH